MCPRNVLKHYSQCFCETVYGWRYCWNGQTLSKAGAPNPNVVGLVQSVEGLDRAVTELPGPRGNCPADILELHLPWPPVNWPPPSWGGLPSLHNYMSQFLEINFSLSLSLSTEYIYSVGSLWFCFSGKPWPFSQTFNLLLKTGRGGHSWPGRGRNDKRRVSTGVCAVMRGWVGQRTSSQVARLHAHPVASHLGGRVWLMWQIPWSGVSCLQHGAMGLLGRRTMMTISRRKSARFCSRKCAGIPLWIVNFLTIPLWGIRRDLCRNVRVLTVLQKGAFLVTKILFNRFDLIHRELSI